MKRKKEVLNDGLAIIEGLDTLLMKAAAQARKAVDYGKRHRLNEQDDPKARIVDLLDEALDELVSAASDWEEEIEDLDREDA